MECNHIVIRQLRFKIYPRQSRSDICSRNILWPWQFNVQILCLSSCWTLLVMKWNVSVTTTARQLDSSLATAWWKLADNDNWRSHFFTASHTIDNLDSDGGKLSIEWNYKMHRLDFYFLDSFVLQQIKEEENKI